MDPRRMRQGQDEGLEIDLRQLVAGPSPCKGRGTLPLLSRSWAAWARWMACSAMQERGHEPDGPASTPRGCAACCLPALHEGSSKALMWCLAAACAYRSCPWTSAFVQYAARGCRLRACSRRRRPPPARRPPAPCGHLSSAAAACSRHAATGRRQRCCSGRSRLGQAAGKPQRSPAAPRRPGLTGRPPGNAGRPP